MDELVDIIPVVGTLNSLYELGSDIYGIYDSYNENIVTIQNHIRKIVPSALYFFSCGYFTI